MSLQNLIKEIEAKTIVANDDLNDTTNHTRAMRQGNKRAATERLVDLKNEYRLLLLSTTAFVLVTGPQAKDLSSLANSENKSFSVDSEDLYRKVVSKIDPRAYMNQTIASSIINNIENAMFEISQEIGVTSYPQLNFKAEYSKMIESEEQFVEVVKNVINDSIGSEMVGIYAVNTIMEQALKRGHGENFTPVLLTTTDEKLVTSLSKDLKRLNNNVFVVFVGKGHKGGKSIPNSISIKESSPEALIQLLDAVKEKAV